MSEDRDFPKLGQRYIVRLNQVWQEETYVADQADGEICAGERFWSRDDLDECPSFNYEKDDWISIREAVSNREQLAAIKEENERLLRSEIERNQLKAKLVALREEGVRLRDGMSHHMNISQVLADANANMYEMVIERDAEIELLKARVAELEDGVARCRHQASYYIGEKEALKNQLMRVRDIANEVLSRKEPANEG